MKPIEISCRYQHPTEFWNCSAQVDEDCRMKSKLGNWYELIFFHDCRQTDAAAMTEPCNPIEISAFDKAVEDSGIV